MIEIQEKGKIPTKKVRQKKCGYCKTKFTYENEDKELYGTGPDDWCYTVKCPTCNIAIPTSIFDKKVDRKDE